MAAFQDCPTCQQSIPRGEEICPHCGLSIRESLRRSDQPSEQQPPPELFEVPVHMGPEQRAGIGFFFFLGLSALVAQAWLSAGIFLFTGAALTPAFRAQVRAKSGVVLGFKASLGIALLGLILAWVLWS